MRVFQCTVDDCARVVVVPDGNGDAGSLLPALGDRRAGVLGWLDASRERGATLRSVLSEAAQGGDRVVVDERSWVVRSDGDEFPVGVPLDAPEVWAAGVSYLRSREAREAESRSHHGGDFYRRVYDAERPEVFLKDAGGRRTVGPGEHLAIRGDSRWTVPEPEVGLVLDADGSVIAFTIGNDMSARDIEGENPLYLAQSKIYADSCAIGPSLWLPPDGSDGHHFEVVLRVVRGDGRVAFEGETSTVAMRRTFKELVAFVLSYNTVEAATILLTGTGIVPPDEFAVRDGDRVEITVPEIGTLSNPVRQLDENAFSLPRVASA